jgi:hypothetical protein
MARHRHSNRRHSSNSRRRHSKQNIMNESVSVVKSTSRRYMPKVKHGLENVGASVTQTATKSVPFFQRMTRKFFEMFTTNKKSRRHRR